MAETHAKACADCEKPFKDGDRVEGHVEFSIPQTALLIGAWAGADTELVVEDSYPKDREYVPEIDKEWPSDLSHQKCPDDECGPIHENCNTTAREIASRTEDAYSFGIYSRREWLRITRFLLHEEGYSDIDVEEILRSKHMRWASDHADGDRHMTLAKFQAYYNFDGFRKSNKTYIAEMLGDAQ